MRRSIWASSVVRPDRVPLVGHFQGYTIMFCSLTPHRDVTGYHYSSVGIPILAHAVADAITRILK